MKERLMSRGTRLASVILLVAPALLTFGSAQADTYFPQTQTNTWGPFEAYWSAHGGLAQFGLPRTSVFPTGKGYDAQWFERALFTFNPKNPEAYQVELQLLGSLDTAKRQGEPPFQPAKDAGSGQFFQATSHNLSGKFLDYWSRTGGVTIYGYPISEPFTEKSLADGKSYQVQYFERNRLELHPELAGTPFEVQLGLLGSEMLDAQGGPGAFANLGRPTFYPPPTSGVVVPPGGIVTSPGAGTPTGSPSVVPDAPPLAPTSRPVLFSSDFSSPDLSAWRPSSALNPKASSPAAWQVQNNTLQQSSVASEGGGADEALLVTTAQFSDAVIDADFYATGSESVGAVVRYTDNGFYLVKLYPAAPNNSAKAELLLITNGVSRTLATAAATSWPGYTQGSWHLLSVKAAASDLSVQVDGLQLLQAQDAQYAKGGVGLYTYADGTTRFDNVRVTAP